MAEPCVKSDKIERLETDVVNINERLNRHSEKIDKISDNNLVLETILKRLEEDGKEQKKHNAEANRTMLSIQTAMTEITFNVKELNTKLILVDNKTNFVSAKLEELDNKGKFDVINVIVKIAIPTLLGLGVGALIMQFIR